MNQVLENWSALTIRMTDRDANRQVGPGELPDLQLNTRWQRSVPQQKTDALEDRLQGCCDPALPRLHPQTPGVSQLGNPTLYSQQWPGDWQP